MTTAIIGGSVLLALMIMAPFAVLGGIIWFVKRIAKAEEED